MLKNVYTKCEVSQRKARGANLQCFIVGETRPGILQGFKYCFGCNWYYSLPKITVKLKYSLIRSCYMRLQEDLDIIIIVCIIFLFWICKNESTIWFSLPLNRSSIINNLPENNNVFLQTTVAIKLQKDFPEYWIN